MLLRQMKYFTAVVECGSFTEAAEECFISQSAVSQQIQALENDLGVKLLHRESRGFSLTPAGEYFYRRARELLAEADRRFDAYWTAVNVSFELAQWIAALNENEIVLSNGRTLRYDDAWEVFK